MLFRSPNNFSRTISIRKANALVAFAGPCMNFILAIIFSIIYGLILGFGGTFLLTTTGEVISDIILSIISMNVGLGVFNLIPLPPLDGSKILTAFLPTNARNWVESHETILMVLFMFIWVTPVASIIIRPIINIINQGLVNLITLVVNLII